MVVSASGIVISMLSSYFLLVYRKIHIFQENRFGDNFQLIIALQQTFAVLPVRCSWKTQCLEVKQHPFTGIRGLCFVVARCRYRCRLHSWIWCICAIPDVSARYLNVVVWRLTGIVAVYHPSFWLSRISDRFAVLDYNTASPSPLQCAGFRPPQTHVILTGASQFATIFVV